MRIGDKVVALCDIVEDGFPKKGTKHVHASAGDTGNIIYTDPKHGFPTVRFDNTGTATIVFPDEIKIR